LLNSIKKEQIFRASDYSYS